MSGIVTLPSGRRLARLSVDQYHEMIAADILHSGDRLELLDGLLVEKPLKSPRQVTTRVMLLQHLFKLPCDGFHIGADAPITMDVVDSEPEPAISIVRGAIGDYRTAHPTPADVLLVIDVVDSPHDQSNAARYAAAGIARYLYVDVAGETMTLHEQPSADGYEKIADVESVDVVVDDAIVGTFAASDVF